MLLTRQLYLRDSLRMLAVFRREVDPIWRGWHYPSLQQIFTSFWELTSVDQIKETATLALVLAILGLSSFYDNAYEGSLIVGNSAQSDSLIRHDGKTYISAAMYLLDTAEISTASDHLAVQAEYIICLFLLGFGARTLLQRRIAVLLKTAQSSGLHVDPLKTSTVLPLQAEERRRLFWSIQALDCMTCLTSGLPPTSALSDCNCRRPDCLLSICSLNAMYSASRQTG